MNIHVILSVSFLAKLVLFSYCVRSLSLYFLSKTNLYVKHGGPILPSLRLPSDFRSFDKTETLKHQHELYHLNGENKYSNKNILNFKISFVCRISSEKSSQFLAQLCMKSKNQLYYLKISNTILKRLRVGEII